MRKEELHCGYLSKDSANSTQTCVVLIEELPLLSTVFIVQIGFLKCDFVSCILMCCNRRVAYWVQFDLRCNRLVAY